MPSWVPFREVTSFKRPVVKKLAMGRRMKTESGWRWWKADCEEMLRRQRRDLGSAGGEDSRTTTQRGQFGCLARGGRQASLLTDCSEPREK